MSSKRLICWYSNGVASLLASKIAIDRQPDLYPDYEVIVARIYIVDEYHEPERDAIVESYLGKKIINLTSDKFESSVDKVIEKTRYMSGVGGARCTKELKKNVRLGWQQEGDVHVFGFDCDEGDRRIGNLLDTEPEIEYYAPLHELGITKKQCFEEVSKAGIPLPKMYQLGYHNNNCIGCLKATGAGYWNKIRVDFPEVFNKRAKQEELCNVSLVTMSNTDVRKFGDQVIHDAEQAGYTVKTRADGRMRVPLRFLPKTAGKHKDLDIGDCGFICEISEQSKIKSGDSLYVI